MPSNLRHTRWSSPSPKKSAKENISYPESSSLDSCLFEIFHSRDKHPSPLKKLEKDVASPSSKKEKYRHNKNASKSDRIGKTPRSDKKKKRQKDIRCYFKDNAKVKVITYSNHKSDVLPMDASPIPFDAEKHEISLNDVMDIENPCAESSFLDDCLSDMEIELLNKSAEANRKKWDKDYSEGSVQKKHKSKDTKSTDVSPKKKSSTSFSVSKTETPVQSNTRSSSCPRDRSPLKLPSELEDQEKPTKFIKTLPLFNSRRILKPISCRFRRYSSMIEIVTRTSTPSFRKAQERFSRTEPRNKRKVNPRDLFDEIDKYDEPSSSKKARKAINTSPTSLPPPVQRLPLFKPMTEMRCYGDAELGVQPLPSSKECKSCCTSETLMWRDTEDGIPLCNACGIRWRKYRYRCTECWYVPMQDELKRLNCGSCGKYDTFKRFKPFKRHKTSFL
ncbi:uncharacterized protein [Clytia hemisphaerica]